MGKLMPLLDGGTALVIVNDAEPDTEIRVIGFVCALHDGGNPPDVRRSTDVSLQPGGSFASVQDRLSANPPKAVEAILRIIAPLSRVRTEVYLHSDKTRTTPIEGIEIGIVAAGEAPAEAVPVPELEDLAAYIKLEP